MKFKNNIFLFIYFVLAFILFPYYRFIVDSPDGLVYVIIAQKYAGGNFQDAVNSFWSPLLSWFFSGLIYIGIEPFAAAKSVQVLIGAFALLGVNTLLPENSRSYIYYSTIACVIIFILYCAFLVLTPDLFFLTLCLWYVVLLKEDSHYINKKYFVLLIGALGAFIYFSKSIGFILFLSSFSVFNFFLYLRKERPLKTILWKYFFGVITFLIITSPWIYSISRKENKFTISSAAEYNFHNIGPKSNPDVFGEVRHPCFWQGLIEPNRQFSVCAWEEPHKMPLEEWSAFESKENFLHYLSVIGKNLLSIRSFYFGLDAGTVLCLALLTVFYYRRKKIVEVFKSNSFLIIVCACCTLPYIFLLVIERYLWINTIAISVLGYFIFSRLCEMNNKIGIPLFIAFVLLFVKTPLLEFKNNFNADKYIFDDREAIAGKISGNTASVSISSENPGDHYLQSGLVSFFSGAKYYGMITLPGQKEKLYTELRKNKIDYLLKWNQTIRIPAELYSDSIFFSKSGLVAYKLKQE